jgi:hypothetical protein
LLSLDARRAFTFGQLGGMPLPGGAEQVVEALAVLLPRTFADVAVELVG